MSNTKLIPFTDGCIVLLNIATITVHPEHALVFSILAGICFMMGIRDDER